MRSRAGKKTPVAIRLAIVLGGLVILAAAGFFLLVQPKKSEASKLDKDIADITGQLSQRQVQAQQAAGLSKILVAKSFKLATAMPEDAQVAEAHLQIDAIARATGVSYDGITTADVIDAASYQVLPFQLTFEGSFYDLTDFLRRLQSLVLVENGKLIANGRLFTVDKVTFDEGAEGFPDIKASVQVYAYVFGHPLAVEGATVTTPATPAAAAAAAGAGAENPEDSTSTTTTPAEGDVP